MRIRGEISMSLLRFEFVAEQYGNENPKVTITANGVTLAEEFEVTSTDPAAPSVFEVETAGKALVSEDLRAQLDPADLRLDVLGFTGTQDENGETIRNIVTVQFVNDLVDENGDRNVNFAGLFVDSVPVVWENVKYDNSILTADPGGWNVLKLTHEGVCSFELISPLPEDGSAAVVSPE